MVVRRRIAGGSTTRHFYKADTTFEKSLDTPFHLLTRSPSKKAILRLARRLRERARQGMGTRKFVQPSHDTNSPLSISCTTRRRAFDPEAHARI